LSSQLTFQRGRIATIRQFFDTFDAVEQTLQRDIAATLAPRPIAVSAGWPGDRSAVLPG
jgi:hypothetical protein